MIWWFLTQSHVHVDFDLDLAQTPLKAFGLDMILVSPGFGLMTPACELGNWLVLISPTFLQM